MKIAVRSSSARDTAVNLGGRSHRTSLAGPLATFTGRQAAVLSLLIAIDMIRSPPLRDDSYKPLYAPPLHVERDHFRSVVVPQDLPAPFSCFVTMAQMPPRVERSNSSDMGTRTHEFFSVFNELYKPHPWHGVSPVVLDKKTSKPMTDQMWCYIECVPGEGLKYEVHKPTGYLMVDRPHKFSSLCPTAYGFMPQTFCGPRIAALCNKAVGRADIKGDEDPLDICVLSSRAITHGDLLLKARPIAGIRMIDDDEADDKIIAVLIDDPMMKDWQDLDSIPKDVFLNIKHYFKTYKQSPDAHKEIVAFGEDYGREEALRVIEASRQDYIEKYGENMKKVGDMMSAFVTMHQKQQACD